MLLDEADVRCRLRRREQVVDDRMNHRQQAVRDAGRSVLRVEQVFDTSIGVEICVAGNRPVRDQLLLEVRLHASRRDFEHRSRSGTTVAPQAFRQGCQHLVVQGDRPGAAETFAHRWIDGLQRIVPVAVAVRGPVRTADHAAVDHLQRAFHMPPDGGLFGTFVPLRMEERNDGIEN